MIFDPCQFCAVTDTWDTTLDQPVRLEGDGVWVGLVSSGRCAFSEDSSAALAGPGTLLTGRSGTLLVPVEPVHLLALHITGEAGDACAAGLEKALFVGCDAFPSIAELIGMLCSDSVQLPAARTASAAFRILCTLSQADVSSPALPPLVAEAIAAIRQHYGELYGVEELSESLGVSKCHLVRAFSAAMGMPPGQYLTQVRLEAAKQLLMHREYPLEVVASLCGFSGANYLCRVFRRHTGQTPAQWRAANLAAEGSDRPLAGEAELYI